MPQHAGTAGIGFAEKVVAPMQPDIVTSIVIAIAYQPKVEYSVDRKSKKNSSINKQEIK